MEIEGKVAVVTGAARGLGASVVEMLLNKGVKVCFCDINDEGGMEQLRRLVEKFGDAYVMYKHCDVCKENEIRELVEATMSKFHGLDIFINNAGIVDEDNWEKMIDVNLGGCVRGSKLAIDYMRTDKGGNGGVILNVSSVSGFTPIVTTPLYTASKHGIIGFSRSMAMLPEVKNSGIRIVCLCPGPIDSPMLHAYRNQAIGWERQIAENFKKVGDVSTDAVSTAVLKLLQDKDNNGKQMIVEKNYGMIYRTDYDEPWTKDYIQLQDLTKN